MGYSTKYSIDLLAAPGSIDLLAAPDQTKEAFRRAFDTHKSERGMRFANLGSGDGFKWYEHELHIVDAMRESGVTAVDLHGEGEVQGDVWDKQFRLKGDKIIVLKYAYNLTRDDQPTSETTYAAGSQ